MSERWIVIPRWDEFQHPDVARSTVPPWIKVYTRLLSDDTYLTLTLAQRGLLHGIWLMYATHRRSTNETSTRRLLVTNKAEARHFRSNLEALNHAGLITFSASRPASNLASLEVDRDREKKVLSAKAPKRPVDNFEPQRANVIAKDPIQAIKAMIQNGVITDIVDLEAELQGFHLNSNIGDDLRKLLQ
jgi:hypothetical protein